MAQENDIEGAGGNRAESANAGVAGAAPMAAAMDAPAPLAPMANMPAVTVEPAAATAVAANQPSDSAVTAGADVPPTSKDAPAVTVTTTKSESTGEKPAIITTTLVTTIQAAPASGEMKSSAANANGNGSAAENGAPSMPQAMEVQQVSTDMMNGNGKMDTDDPLANFKVLYIITQLCGITLILLMGSWVFAYMGGVAWRSEPAQEFYWHPLLMTIGMIFLYGNSILVYRGFRNLRKKNLKFAHAGIHLSAFVITIIALIAAFDSHNFAKAGPIPNLYSLHSWLGLFACILFFCQYVLGFTAYLVPGVKDKYRTMLMPFHVYFGIFGFVLAIASALTGLTEKSIFSIPNFSALPSAMLLSNFCGIFFMIFGALVVYLVTEVSYKRRPLPEDTMLLTGANE